MRIQTSGVLVCDAHGFFHRGPLFLVKNTIFAEKLGQFPINHEGFLVRFLAICRLVVKWATFSAWVPFGFEANPQRCTEPQES